MRTQGEVLSSAISFAPIGAVKVVRGGDLAEQVGIRWFHKIGSETDIIGANPLTQSGEWELARMRLD
jgi:hypothetical protein